MKLEKNRIMDFLKNFRDIADKFIQIKGVGKKLYPLKENIHAKK